MNYRQSYNWVFTWNNYDDDVEIYLTDLLQKGIKWLAYSEEEAPTTGTPHLQGFFGTWKRSTLTCVLKTIFEERGMHAGGVHIEPMKGTLSQNEDYCSKAGRLQKYGDFPSQGERKDAHKAASSRAMMIREAIQIKKDGGVFEPYYWMEKWNDTYIVNKKYIQEVFNTYQKPEKYKPKKVIVLWGPTGTGKSRTARAYFEENKLGEPFVHSQAMGRWWDGYEGQKGVIIDEYTDKIWTVQEMNGMLDVYPYRVPVKGTSTTFAPDIIIITSNFDPETWYVPKFIGADSSGLPEGEHTVEHKALMRRITEIIKID